MFVTFEVSQPLVSGVAEVALMAGQGLRRRLATGVNALLVTLMVIVLAFVLAFSQELS